MDKTSKERVSFFQTNKHAAVAMSLDPMFLTGLDMYDMLI